MAERQHPEERDVDAIFESIVARWDETPTEPPGTDEAGPAAPRPQSTGDVHPPRPGRRGPVQSTGDVDVPLPGREPRPREDWFPEPVPWRTDPTHSVADALLGNDPLPDDDDEEGFTPPPPAPLPPLGDRLFWGAVAGLVLGPLWLLWIVFTRSGGFWSGALSIGLVVGGFACLVLRQPTDRADGPDDGARV